MITMCNFTRRAEQREEDEINQEMITYNG